MRWFAGRGHPVTGVDRDAAALAQCEAVGETLLADIENGPWPLAGRQFAAVVVTNYLWRPLFAQIVEAVAPGGVLLHETFAQGNETVGKPSRADFLLAPGELLRAYAGLRVVAYEDGFLPEPDRFVQRIAAVREPAGAGPARYLL
jgi:SAM-dependent methyltransferase